MRDGRAPLGPGIPSNVGCGGRCATGGAVLRVPDPCSSSRCLSAGRGIFGRASTITAIVSQGEAHHQSILTEGSWNLSGSARVHGHTEVCEPSDAQGGDAAFRPPELTFDASVRWPLAKWCRCRSPWRTSPPTTEQAPLTVSVAPARCVDAGAGSAPPALTASRLDRSPTKCFHAETFALLGVARQWSADVAVGCSRRLISRRCRAPRGARQLGARAPGVEPADAATPRPPQAPIPEALSQLASSQQRVASKPRGLDPRKNRGYAQS